MLAASISRLEKPSAASRSNVGEASVLGADVQRLEAELLADRPLVEDELDVERGRQRLLDFPERFVGEALGLERRVVDRRGLAERAVADRVGFDLADLRFAVAERAQRVRHGAVDDLEVAAAGELLELHQREVGLDAGGVAIHHQTDRAGRRDHGGLRVAVAVLLAELDRLVPGGLGVGRERLVALGGERAERVMVERHRRDRDLLVAVLLAIGGAACGCASRAACGRGSPRSRGTARASPPFRPRSHS